MSLWKGTREAPGAADMRRIEGLLREAVALDPRLAKAFFELGVLLAEQERHAEAIEQLRRATSLQPSLATGALPARAVVSAHRAEGSRREGAGNLPPAQRRVERTEMNRVNRRAFIQSVFVHRCGGAAFADDGGAQTQAERRRAGWIIPTNKPDRFELKVMAFNPIPAPDLKAWELAVEGAWPAGGPPEGCTTSRGCRGSRRAAG